MHVLTVSHYFPSHGGGLERVADQLVTGLAERGMIISWLSSDTDPPPPRAKGVSCIQVAAINVIERLFQLPYPIWCLTSIPRLWREIGKADVVHVHEHLYMPSILAILIARLRGRPILITQHMGALGLGHRALTLAYESGTKLLAAILMPMATRVIFISANVQRFFRYENSARSALVYNGVEVARFTPASVADQIAVRERLGLPANKRIALFVGRFVRKKGLHVITELSARFPDVLWVLVGSGPEQPEEPPPNLKVIGRVEHDRLPLFYQASDLLILPSSGEGFPLVVQEALCCGAGVLSTLEVASACPQAATLIRTCPASRDEISVDDWDRSLRTLLADKEYLSDRASRSAAAHSLWSWAECVANYSRILNKLVVRRECMPR